MAHSSADTFDAARVEVELRLRVLNRFKALPSLTALPQSDDSRQTFESIAKVLLLSPEISADKLCGNVAEPLGNLRPRLDAALIISLVNF